LQETPASYGAQCDILGAWAVQGGDLQQNKKERTTKIVHRQGCMTIFHLKEETPITSKESNVPYLR